MRADLVGGADWTAEATRYSDDPGSGAKGGDLGAIAKGDMVQEFEDAVFSLKLDEISQPVKTAYGYHVIQVTGITPAKQYTLDEIKPDPTATVPATVKERIKTTLLGSEKSETWRKWIEAQKTAVGVAYRDDMATTTTTSAGAGATTTVAPSTETTAAPSSTTTTAGATITTAAPTSTTAKP